MQRIVPNVSVKIHIAAGKADWVFGDEAAEARVVEAGTRELQSSGRIEFSARELVAARECRVRRVAKGIIARLCCQRTRSNA